MTPKQIRVAAVGCADIGRLAAWARLPYVTISAVCDATGPLAARTAELFTGSSAFTSVEDLLAVGSYDVIDVSLPASQQFEVCVSCLKAGNRVLCTVPFMGSSELAKLANTAAQHYNGTIVPAFPLRFHPLVQELKQLLVEDDLGTPALVDVFLSAEKPSQPPALGASLVTGLQAVDVARYLVGELTLLHAVMKKSDPTWAVDDIANSVMESQSAVVTVTSRWGRDTCGNRVTVSGSAGTAIVDLDASIMRYSTAAWPEWRTHHTSDARPLFEMTSQLADAILSEKTLPMTYQDGFEALKLCSY